MLPGGGYAEHAAHEAEPIAGWLETVSVRARVFRYPVQVRHLVPLEAVRAHGAGDVATWTTLAASWIAEHADAHANLNRRDVDRPEARA